MVRPSATQIPSSAASIGTGARGAARGIRATKQAASPASFQGIESWTGQNFFRASVVSKAIGKTRKTVFARAAREGWPLHPWGNRFAVRPPSRFIAACRQIADSLPAGQPVSLTVTFEQLGNSAAKQRIMLRAAAVFHVATLLESRRAATIVSAYRQTIRQFQALLSISPRSLDRWRRLYQVCGLDGLVGQQGRSGRRKAAAAERN